MLMIPRSPKYVASNPLLPSQVLVFSMLETSEALRG